MIKRGEHVADEMIPEQMQSLREHVSIEVGIFLKRQISTSGLTIVPKTGHTINLEEPALFNQYISNFFQAIENNSWGPRDNRAKIITN